MKYEFALVSLVVLVFSLLNLCVSSGNKALYTVDDPLLILDVNNFSSIYKQDRSFFVEFYSSWCGACIQYAPKFRQFAKRIEKWSPLVQIAVVDCSLSINQELCREHDVAYFPYLKFFKPNSSDHNDGRSYTGDKHSLNDMLLDLAEYVQEDGASRRLPYWPNFQYVEDSESLDDLWKKAGSSASYMALVAEADPPRFAWALMINYAKDDRIRVFAAKVDNPITEKLKGDGHIIMPKVYLFKKGNPSPIYVSENGATFQDVQEKILESVFDGRKESKPKETGDAFGGEQETHPKVKANWKQHEVQMTDLKSAMYYMLTQEIPRRKVIDNEELVALKMWIHLLHEYGPGPTPLRRLFSRLDDWLKTKEVAISNKEWTDEVEKVQSELGHPLPSNLTWMACRGSEPHLRGYTCGLWTLMHVLTVNAYKAGKNNASFNPVPTVLEPIHQFIYRFLSCKVCGMHFHRNAEKTLGLISHPDDTVLWLWKAHNIANKVLAGKESDDPAFPKRQFPPPSLCPQCWENGQFNDEEVKNFLVRYYSDVKNDSPKPAASYVVTRFDAGQMTNGASRTLNINPRFGGAARGFENVNILDQLEENERRIRSLDEQSKRNWRRIPGDSLSSSSGRAYQVIWLLIVAVAVIVMYVKYRKNRSKFWKTFYYYNDYKFCPWSQSSHENATKFRV
ncbi:hypothetical protein AB6A40_003158 [Gnathostoma spinigerum]|uniref:Sulfhydryl oxidase n=1 Tax=Gnathostoma spinigerum TaxID=75299 RepID=A0ABD6EE96_9BILA